MPDTQPMPEPQSTPPAETQKTIADWANTAFGPVIDQTKLVDRAAIELTELREAVQAGQTNEIGHETADVLILLYRLLELNGLSVSQVLNDKMSINRQRTWERAGDGTGGHKA
ncbi:hypothetical protein GCM10017044_15030 [Kordiimonas sediminis]|uniref:Nucleotide pyrophosphohydrolase n=1 Tax=Kordiimonas sediminis TaxID=1735581 RepID=A0A919ARK3_9PROT|nr:dATP/dGTP pyrophosphohydrolase domain-containing protein [Kordiimonas sediminis]GHF21099.1 hypothetical protein GCM10017044_15030 [Kordiimonas sediminis]